MQRRKWKVTITLLTGLTLVWIPVFDGSMFTVRLQDFLHLRSLTENKVDKEPFIRNYSVRTGSQILWKTLENVCWDSNVNGCWQPTDGFLFYSLIEGHFITIGEKFVFTTKSSRWNWCCVRLYINKTTISCFPGKTVLLKLNSTCFFHFLCSGDIHLTPLWFYDTPDKTGFTLLSCAWDISYHFAAAEALGAFGQWWVWSGQSSLVGSFALQEQEQLKQQRADSAPAAPEQEFLPKTPPEYWYTLQMQ